MFNKYAEVYKFAIIYRIASLFTYASTAQEAVRELVNLIDYNELIPIGENYQFIKLKSTSDAEKIEAFNSLQELISELNSKYSGTENAEDIAYALSVILSDAEDDIEDTSDFNIKDEVGGIAQDMGIQEGESEAMSGGFSVSQDMNEKLQRQREQKKEKRYNPLTREKHLEQGRESVKRWIDKNKEKFYQMKDFSKLKSKIISELMTLGMSKEDAERKVEELRLQHLEDKLIELKDQGDLSSEDAKNKLLELNLSALEKARIRIKDFSKFYKTQKSIDSRIQSETRKNFVWAYQSQARKVTKALLLKELLRNNLTEEQAQQEIAKLSTQDVDTLKDKYVQEAEQMAA